MHFMKLEHVLFSLEITFNKVLIDVFKQDLFALISFSACQ